MIFLLVFIILIVSYQQTEWWKRTYDCYSANADFPDTDCEFKYEQREVLKDYKLPHDKQCLFCKKNCFMMHYTYYSNDFRTTCMCLNKYNYDALVPIGYQQRRAISLFDGDDRQQVTYCPIQIHDRSEGDIHISHDSYQANYFPERETVNWFDMLLGASAENMIEINKNDTGDQLGARSANEMRGYGEANGPNEPYMKFLQYFDLEQPERIKYPGVHYIKLKPGVDLATMPRRFQFKMIGMNLIVSKDKSNDGREQEGNDKYEIKSCYLSVVIRRPIYVVPLNEQERQVKVGEEVELKFYIHDIDMHYTTKEEYNTKMDKTEIIVNGGRAIPGMKHKDCFHGGFLERVSFTKDLKKTPSMILKVKGLKKTDQNFEHETGVCVFDITTAHIWFSDSYQTTTNMIVIKVVDAYEVFDNPYKPGNIMEVNDNDEYQSYKMHTGYHAEYHVGLIDNLKKSPKPFIYETDSDQYKNELGKYSGIICFPNFYAQDENRLKHIFRWRYTHYGDVKGYSHNMFEQQRNIPIMGQSEAHLRVQQLENYPIFYYFNPNSTEKQGSKTFMSYDIASQKVTDQFDQIDVKVFLKNGIKDRPGESKFLEIPPTDDYLFEDPKLNQSQVSVFKLVRDGKIYIEPVSYPLPAYINSQITLGFKKHRYGDYFSNVESSSFQAHIYGICIHNNALGQLFNGQPQSQYYIHNFEGSEFKYFLFRNGQIYKNLSLSIYGSLIPNKIQTQINDGYVDKNTKLSSIYTIELDQNNQDPLTLLKPLVNVNDHVLTSSIDFQSEEKTLNLQLLQISKAVISIKNKLNDLNINWYNYEGSLDTVLVEFDVVDQAGNDTNSVFELKIETSQEYLNADLIFDSNHLKYKKLVIKQEMFVRAVLPDYLNNIKAYVKLKDTIKGTKVLSEYKSNTIDFNIKFYFEKYSAIIPPTSKYFYCVNELEGEDYKTVDLKDYIIDNVPTLSVVMDAQPEDNKLKVSVSGTVLTIDCKESGSKSHQFKLEYKVGDSQTQYLQFMVIVRSNMFRIKSTIYGDGKMCVFPYKKGQPCYVPRLGPKQFKIYTSQPEHGHEIFYSHDYEATQSFEEYNTTDGDTKTTLDYFNINANPNFKIEYDKMRMVEVPQMVMPVGNFSQVFTQRIHSKTNVYFRHENTYTLASRERPHFFFYSLQYSRYSKVDEKDKIAPVGSSWVSPFMIYCKGIEDAFHSYLQITEKGDQTVELLERQLGEHILKWTPTQEGSYTFKFKCYKLYKHFDDHQNQKCDYSFKICREQSITLKAINAPYLDYDGKQIQIYKGQKISHEFELKKGDDDPAKNHIVIRNKDQTLDSNLPSFGMFRKDVDKVKIKMIWDTEKVNVQNYEVVYSVLKRDNLNSYVNSQIRLQVLPNNAPVILDKQTKEVENVYIGHRWEATFKFRDDDVGDYISKIELEQIECGDSQQKMTMTVLNIQSDSSSRPNHKDILKVSINSVPDRNNKQDYSTCYFKIIAHDSRQLKGEYKFILKPKLKYEFEILDVANNKVAYGYKKNVKLQAFYSIGGVRTNVYNMLRIGVELPQNFPGQVQQIYDRQLQFQIIMLGLDSYVDSEYTMKVKLFNIQYHNWEQIYTSQDYKIDVKQLKDFTFDYPDTNDKQKLVYGSKIEYALNPVNNKGFTMQWKLENGPLDEYKFENDKLIIECQSWKMNQYSLLRNMIVKSIIKFDDSEHVVSKDFKFLLIRTIGISNDLNGQKIQIDPGVTYFYRLKVSSGHYPSDLKFSIKDNKGSMIPQISNTGNIKIPTSICSKDGQIQVLIEDIHDPTSQNKLSFEFTLEINTNLIPSPKLVLVDTSDTNWINSQILGNVQQYAETSQQLYKTAQYRSYHSVFVMDYQGGSVAVDKMSITGINPENTNQVENIKIVEDVSGQLNVKECGGQPLKYTLFKVDWKPVGVYITSDLFSINYKTDTNKEASLPFTFYNIDQTLQQGEFEVNIIYNTTDCPCKFKFGEVWKCQLFVDSAINQNPFTFQMWTSQSQADFKIQQYGESYFEGTLPSRSHQKITIWVDITKTIEYFNKQNQKQKAYQYRIVSFDLVVEEHNSPPVYMQLSDGIITKHDEHVENQTIYKMYFKFSDHEGDNMTIQNCHSPSHNYFNDTSKLQPLLNLSKQDPSGNSNSEIDYIYEKQNHLATQTGIIVCDLVDSKNNNQVEIKVGISITPRCARYPDIVGMGKSKDNYKTKTKQTYLKFMYDLHSDIYSSNPTKNNNMFLKLAVRNIAQKFILHFGGMSFVCPSSDCTIGSYDTNNFQHHVYQDTKKILFYYHSSRIPHIGYIWIENRKEISNKKLQENPNDEQQNTQFYSINNRTLTQFTSSISESIGGGVINIPGLGGGVGGNTQTQSQYQANIYQPDDMNDGLIDAGSSLTYVYAFKQMRIDVSKTDQNIFSIDDENDITPSGYSYKPKLKASNDDRDLIYEDKDNSIRFEIDYNNRNDNFQLNYAICVGFYVQVKSGSKKIDSTRYQLGYFMSQDDGQHSKLVKGSCLFNAKNYTFSGDDYYGLCVFIRYQNLEDFSQYLSQYSNTNTNVDSNCMLVDVVDKTDQQKDVIQLVSSQELNYFGGNYIKFKYIKPTITPKKYSMHSYSKILRVNIGGHNYTFDIQSSSSYEYIVHSYTLNENYQTDKLKLVIFAANSLNGMQYGYQKLQKIDLDYTLEKFIAGRYLDKDFKVQKCPEGFYCPDKINISPPRFCVPGTYREKDKGADGTRCDICDNGYFCPVNPKNAISTQFSKRQDCPAGFICNYEKLGYFAKEMECPGGFICTKGLRDKFNVTKYTIGAAIQANKLYRCKPGYYCYRRVQTDDHDDLTVHAPKKCFDGFVCGDSEKFPHGQGICQKGYYCNSTPPFQLFNISEPVNKLQRVDNCTDFRCICPVGFACKRGSTTPKPCGKGFFSNKEGLDECIMCQEGHYCPYDRNEDQIQCEKGHFCPYNKTISPYECQPNSYQDEVGQVKCKECPAGYSCPEQKMDKKNPCPAGYVCLQQSRPVICPPGFYCKEGTMNLPYYAPLIDPPTIWTNYLQYTENSEDSEETKILFKLYNENAKQYCNVMSTNEPLKQEQPTNETYRCPFSCPKGSKCPMQSAEPILCQVGQYQNEQYSTDTCKLCEIGYSCQDRGIQDLNISSPYACQEGKICTTKGMSQQTEDCDAGFYCGKMTDELTNFKKPCSIGYYCPPGTAYEKYNVSDPKKSPKYCPKGTYSQREGLSACELCIDGHQCVDCKGDENHIQISIEYANGDVKKIQSCINPQPCAKGTFRSQDDASECRKCDAGTYNPLTTQVLSESCKKCSAGLICNKQGASNQKIDNKNVKICDEGYYCEEGTTEATKIECPDGYVCPPGLKSREEVEGFPCPPSRICKTGTKSSLQEYKDCTENMTKCSSIGDPCEMNKFCPRLIGEQNIKDFECPKGTESLPKSYTIENCTQDKNAPNTDYLKERQGELNDEWTQFDYIQDLVSLDELQLETYQYKDFIFQLANIPEDSIIGRDYTLYMEYDDIDKPRREGQSANVINLVAVENQQPVSLAPTPHIYYESTTGLDCFRFRILANTRIKFKLKVGVFIGAKIFRDNYVKWKRNYKLENMTEANYNISYAFLLDKNAIGSTSIFYDPANIQVDKGITNTEVSEFQGKDYKFYKELLVTNVPKDFDKMMDKNVQYTESRSGQTLFGQSNLDFHPFQYIPFISDCDEFGAFLPLWKLLYLKDSDKVGNSTIKGNCTNIPFSETRPVEFFRPTNLPYTDYCNIILTCRYADRLLVPGYDPMKFWMKYSDISKTYLMYITRHKMSKQDFRTGLNIGYSDPKKIQVEAVKNVEENSVAAQGRYVPTNVTLYLKFYQVNSSTQEILTAKLYYGKFTKIDENDYLKNPKFKFQIIYQSMTWHETLDNFGFEANYYYIFVVGVCLVIFMMIFGIWLFYHNHSNVTPTPTLKINVFTSYSVKSLIGLFLSIVPICSLFLLLRQIIYNPNFISDLIKPIKSDYLVESSVDEDKTNQGRLGIGLFTIGIFTIYKCINLLIPPIYDEYLDDQRKSTRISANRENNKKKAYLYYSALLSISFGSIYNQFAKVPAVYENLLGLEVGLYAGISNKIYQNTRAGFNDDLMALPMKGTFSLIQLMIAMKIDVFTMFLRGYLIQIGIVVLKKYVINPIRIDIQDAVASFKKKKLPGAKSAQDLTLSLSRTRRVYQEQLNDLGLGSMEFLSSWIFVVLMMFQLICAKELNIKISKDFLQYFVVFTLIQAFAEIPYNIFINNGIECRTGRKVYELLQECDDIFKFRTKMWCLSDKSTLPGIFSPVPRTARSLQKMGFSDQYFFMNTLGIMGMICIIYSIDFWINKNYNPFRDLAMIWIIIFTLILCYSVQILFTSLGKYFKFWKVNQETIDKIIQKRDQEYEIDLSIEKQIIEIFYNMDEKIKTQQRDIAINYIVCQLIQNAHEKNNNYEVRFSNLMKVFKKIEEFIEENTQIIERKTIQSQRSGFFQDNDRDVNKVELQMVDIDNNPEQIKKIKQNLMFEKNLQRKTFNRSCLINFHKLNIKQIPRKYLENDLSYNQLIDDGDVPQQQKKIQLTDQNIRQKNSQARRKQEKFKQFYQLRNNNSKVAIKK